MEMQSTEIKDLVTSLSKAQAEIKPAKKDVENAFFKSKYADLASVQEACMPFLTKNGLSVTQTMDFIDGKHFLITTLFHTTGQWIKSIAQINPVKNDPQGFGSALTYLRRYELSAISGVSQEDDDGNAASSGIKSADKKPDLNMAYDAEQNQQAYDYALGKINGFSSAADVDVFIKKNNSRLCHLPKEKYEDVLQAAVERKTDLNNKHNGAH